STGLGMIVFMSMIGTAIILPLFMQNMLGFTALESGLVLLPGAVVMGLFNPVTGRLFDLYGARYLAIGGFAILTITTYMFTTLTTETTIMYMAILYAVRTISISIVIFLITASGINIIQYELLLLAY